MYHMDRAGLLLASPVPGVYQPPEPGGKGAPAPLLQTTRGQSQPEPHHSHQAWLLSFSALLASVGWLTKPGGAAYLVT